MRRLIAVLLLLSGTVSAQGVISTVVGADWVFNGDGLPALDVPLGEMRGVAAGPDGSYYFLDRGNQMVMQVDAQGTLRVIAGNGLAGSLIRSAPSARNVAFSSTLVDIIADGLGNLYVSDTVSVLRIESTGRVSIVAGGGSQFPGDGGLATNARINAFPSVPT